MKKYYIAYGSSLNLGQMSKRCPTAKVVGTGIVKDYQLIFWRVATIVPKKGSNVPIAVWEIDDDCEEALDMYEGYPHLYRKEHIDVEINTQVLKGIVYIMNYGKLQKPSRTYFQIISDGYDDAGLDKDALFDALKHSIDQIL